MSHVYDYLNAKYGLGFRVWGQPTSFKDLHKELMTGNPKRRKAS